MILAVLISGCTSSPSPGPANNTGSISLNKNFNDLADSLHLLPAGATYVRYTDTKADSRLGQYLSSSYWNTIPPSSIFGANAVRDAFAVYPAYQFGNTTSSGAGNVISLTDFGNATLNQSYPQVSADLNGNSIPIKEVFGNYYFSPDTFPVVSGTENATIATLYTMAGISGSNTSYDDYADLFNVLSSHHIPINGMTLEVVGNNATFPVSGINLTPDKFYAAIGPTNQTVVVNGTIYTQYYYVIVVHVNQAPSSGDIQNLYLYASSNLKMGFSDYNVQVYGDYIVVQAHAPIQICLNDDMMNWGFMKYQAGT